MKKTFHYLSLLLSGVGIALCSCQQEKPLPIGGISTVSIEKVGCSSENGFSVMFVPSEDASGFRYAVGEESDYGDFLSGAMNSTTVEGDSPLQVDFTGLVQGHIYTVYATAVDMNGVEGDVASLKVLTSPDDFSVSAQYVTDCSAAFSVSLSSAYYGFRYHFGTDADRSGFYDGTIKGEMKTETDTYTYNYYGLAPDTDYIFYVQPVDRSGIPAEIMEKHIATLAEGDCPSAALEYENDIYRGEYRLLPGPGCSKMTAIICEQGGYDDIIFGDSHWAGDIFSMMQNWESSSAGSVAVSQNGEPLVLDLDTPQLRCGNVIEIYAMLYDNEGNNCGVFQYSASTPSYDENLPEACVTVTVSDITQYGATYTYECDSNTFGLMYDTVDADWYDDFKKNDPEYHEYYIHDKLFSNGRYWSYGNGQVVYTEKYGMPSKRYYAVGCPMNANGPEGGWGDMAVQEYTTLSY